MDVFRLLHALAFRTLTGWRSKRKVRRGGSPGTGMFIQPQPVLSTRIVKCVFGSIDSSGLFLFSSRKPIISRSKGEVLLGLICVISVEAEIRGTFLRLSDYVYHKRSWLMLESRVPLILSLWDSYKERAGIRSNAELSLTLSTDLDKQCPVDSGQARASIRQHQTTEEAQKQIISWYSNPEKNRGAYPITYWTWGPFGNRGIGHSMTAPHAYFAATARSKNGILQRDPWFQNTYERAGRHQTGIENQAFHDFEIDMDRLEFTDDQIVNAVLIST